MCLVILRSFMLCICHHYEIHMHLQLKLKTHQSCTIEKTSARLYEITIMKEISSIRDHGCTQVPQYARVVLDHVMHVHFVMWLSLMYLRLSNCLTMILLSSPILYYYEVEYISHVLVQCLTN